MNKTKIHRRTDLWHGKYNHCIRIFLREAPCLRDINQTPDKVRAHIQRRRDWGVKLSANLNPKQPGSWFNQGLEITAEDENRVLSMLDFLRTSTAAYRKVISGDWMYFYSADPGFIDSIETLSFLERRGAIQRSRIDLQGTSGTVRLQESPYQHRSYFRGYLRLTDQQNQALQRYLTQNPDIRLSPALKEWTENMRQYYIGDYFFIDHSDMGIVTLLSLIVPGIIRRTKPIEIAK